jgi:hypothetical protein
MKLLKLFNFFNKIKYGGNFENSVWIKTRPQYATRSLAMFLSLTYSHTSHTQSCHIPSHEPPLATGWASNVYSINIEKHVSCYCLLDKSGFKMKYRAAIPNVIYCTMIYVRHKDCNFAQVHIYSNYNFRFTFTVNYTVLICVIVPYIRWSHILSRTNRYRYHRHDGTGSRLWSKKGTTNFKYSIVHSDVNVHETNSFFRPNFHFVSILKRNVLFYPYITMNEMKIKTISFKNH